MRSCATIACLVLPLQVRNAIGVILLLLLMVQSISSFQQCIRLHPWIGKYHPLERTPGFMLGQSRHSTAFNVSSKVGSDILQGETKETETVQSLKTEIESEADLSKGGLSATRARLDRMERLLAQLESKCLLREPARDPRMEGKWIVQYTTAPPPSNGKLGVFQGAARQVISLEEGSYVSAISVPPNDWLGAELAATWEEWDGMLLDGDGHESQKVLSKQDENVVGIGMQTSSKGTDTKSSDTSTFWTQFFNRPGSLSNSQSTKYDYGASCWKVTFDTLSVRIFGVPLFTKQFENVSRVWRTSYLDDDTRIVRAGRTGKPEDDFVFYMKRET